MPSTMTAVAEENQNQTPTSTSTSTCAKVLYNNARCGQPLVSPAVDYCTVRSLLVLIRSCFERCLFFSLSTLKKKKRISNIKKTL